MIWKNTTNKNKQIEPIKTNKNTTIKKIKQKHKNTCIQKYNKRKCMNWKKKKKQNIHKVKNTTSKNTWIQNKTNI